MSEMAEKHQKYDLALAVYEACLEPGFHQKFLGKKYEELKSRLGSKENKRVRSFILP
ncbi:hypothetical protein KJ693_09490 [bacterium]|nr:hypothetical protein [bacterium]MBU1615525.1 hypothetical protein [bacterium]